MRTNKNKNSRGCDKSGARKLPNFLHNVGASLIVHPTRGAVQKNTMRELQSSGGSQESERIRIRVIVLDSPVSEGI